MTVAPADLGLYLGADVDTDRAQYLIDRATDLCQTIVNPLPSGADAVVLDVAGRAYVNPSNVTSQGVGPFQASYGTAAGGLWLTRQNKVALRRLAGTGSAYSIDPTPADVGKGLPFWDWDTSASKGHPASAVEAGAPGYWLPVGADAPADFATLVAATITPPDPTIAWSVGQYVVLGDNTLACWAIDAISGLGEWVRGIVPDPGGGRF